MVTPTPTVKAQRRRSLRRAAVLGAFTVGVGGVLALSGGAGAGPSRLHGQNFFSNCYFSHIAPDDPIVFPNEPGVSHSHTFFGSRSTNAFSTVDTLRASPTTCRRSADTAAYW